LIEKCGYWAKNGAFAHFSHESPPVLRMPLLVAIEVDPRTSEPSEPPLLCPRQPPSLSPSLSAVSASQLPQRALGRSPCSTHRRPPPLLRWPLLVATGVDPRAYKHAEPPVVVPCVLRPWMGRQSPVAPPRVATSPKTVVTQLSSRGPLRAPPVPRTPPPTSPPLKQRPQS
jgi:hypothetical protein